MRFSTYTLPLLLPLVSTLNPVVAIKMSRDVDLFTKTGTTPLVGNALTRRATEETAQTDVTTGQGVVSFLQVLQQANIKYVHFDIVT